MLLIESIQEYGISFIVLIAIAVAIAVVLFLSVSSAPAGVSIFCGNGVCDSDETSEDCPRDCPPPENDTRDRSVSGRTIYYRALDIEERGKLIETIQGVQETGVPPNGSDVEFADVDNDGVITLEDLTCVMWLLDGFYETVGECLGCSSDADREICHDSIDNDCDGQTDRETYDNGAGTFYGGDLCACSEETPCDMQYDSDGIPGGSAEIRCASVSGLGQSNYGWYGPEELACGENRTGWTLGCGGTTYECTQSGRVWMWWNGEQGTYEAI